MVSSLRVRCSSASKLNVSGVPGHRRAVKSALILAQWEKRRSNSSTGLRPRFAGAESPSCSPSCSMCSCKLLATEHTSRAWTLIGRVTGQVPLSGRKGGCSERNTRLWAYCRPTGMYGPPPCRKRKMKVTGWSAQMYSALVGAQSSWP
jgi:hypothetical protein